jgi:integrase
LESTWAEPLAPGSNHIFADCPLSEFRTKAIKILRDRKLRIRAHDQQHDNAVEGPGNTEAANSRVKAIRAVLKWALETEAGNLEHNWAQDVGLFKGSAEGFPTWTLQDIQQFEAAFPIGTRPRLALALLLFTGQRRGDVVRLGKPVLGQDGKLRFTQEKNQRRKPVTVSIPILPELRQIIDATPCGDLTYLVSSRGTPYRKESFGNWFSDCCRQAGLKGRSAHGLRKACVVSLIKRNCTAHQVMAITGHRTLKEIDRYAREYAREQAAEQVLDKWLIANAA